MHWRNRLVGVQGFHSYGVLVGGQRRPLHGDGEKDRRTIGWCIVQLAMVLVNLSLAFFTPGCGGNGPTESLAPKVIDDPVMRMRAAMAADDWQLASQYSQRVLIANPDDPELITDAAKIAARCDRKREAAQLLVDAAASARYEPSWRVDIAVQALIDVGELYRAIDLLEQSLESDPENDQHRRVLVGFLGEAQRMDQIGPHLMKLIQKRSFDVALLLSMCETSTRRFETNTAQHLMQRNPSDHRVRLGEAFALLYQHDAIASGTVLRVIIDHHPDFGPAHAMYGRVLAAEGKFGEIPAWLENAPSDSSDFADYWLTLGDWAYENDRLAEASRAYWEATQRDANHSGAWDRLAHSLRRLRDDDSPPSLTVSQSQLEQVQNRTSALLDFRASFNEFAKGGQKSQRAATEVARELAKLGRYWEAEAWSAVATTLTEDPSDDLTDLREMILGSLAKDSSWISKNLAALAIDLSALPAPSRASSWHQPSRSYLAPTIASTDHIRLSEESDRWGLGSVGVNNGPADGRAATIARSLGAGGGAIDYDLDGSADLLAMGAGGTMLQRDSFPNELMRNVGGRFDKVTELAGVGDRGFGQGVAIGDFNEDGFPDLYFANLGRNRLLRNNGDGTFTDCTDQAVDSDAQAWSTSAAFVDIDGNGITDLAVTNYCKIVAKLDQLCPTDGGALGHCMPLSFSADTDAFLMGTGDGRLTDTSSEWVTDASAGRGLGILAGSIDGANIGLFIANDMSRNMFYTRAQSPPMHLIESAAVRGVAVDGQALEQASMGIASSDFDLDGDLDLYVTGFSTEYNIYYEQIAPGIWRDETSKLHLVQPTLSMVGFGTQAIDLDCDGIDEIIVTNGHIADSPGPNDPPYEQPFQAFRRGREGNFQLLDDDAWGEYFATPHVGRALWTMDVNQDGRNDVMITHAREQLRLLVNRGNDQNDRIGFELVGTQCSRDAVGAIVRFECNNRERTLWALAGDGYLCSNERILRAGLEKAARIRNVTVTWQDGSVDHIGTLDTNAEYVIVQGEGNAFARRWYRR